MREEGKRKESPSDRAASASRLRAGRHGRGTPKVLISEPKESSDASDLTRVGAVLDEEPC
jgi:hypothetical protein